MKKYAGRMMHLSLFTILFMLSANVVFAGAPIYKSNVLTAQHVSVQGTHVAVIPPSGSKPASLFRGFEIPSRNITYQIIERMGVPYKETEGTLTAQALEAEGITLLDSSKVTLNNDPAILLTCTKKQNEEEMGLLIFAFGGNNLSTLIYGSYPLTDKSAAGTIRNSMLSAIFQPQQQKENTGGDYKLSSAGTAFEFAGEASRVRYYTVEGKKVSNNVEDAVYTASVLMQEVPQGEQQRFAENAMTRYMSSYEHTILSRKNISYGGLSGIEIVADFKGATRRDRTASGGTVNRTVPGKGYQVMLFDNRLGRIYVFNGIAVKDADNYLAQFMRITSSLIAW